MSGRYGYVAIDVTRIYLSWIDVKNLLLMSDVIINSSKVYIDVEVIENTSNGPYTAAYICLGTGYNESQLSADVGSGLTGRFVLETLAAYRQQRTNFPRQVISFDLSEVRGNPLCFVFNNCDCDMYIYNIWLGE